MRKRKRNRKRKKFLPLLLPALLTVLCFFLLENSLLPMGAVRVDYETAFSSVGINQINYKIWLAVHLELRIVNPLYREDITLERKIMLADLVFSGKVPAHYFQISRPNEYLLTE